MNFPPINHDFAVPTAEQVNQLDTRFQDVRGNRHAARSMTYLDQIKISYPRIYNQIVFLWGSQELQNRFARWILTDQDGRRGWPAHIHLALLTISNDHAAAFKLEASINFKQPKDKW